MPNEQAAGATIDRLRNSAGWAVQDYKHHNPGSAPSKPSAEARKTGNVGHVGATVANVRR